MQKRALQIKITFLKKCLNFKSIVIKPKVNENLNMTN